MTTPPPPEPAWSVRNEFAAVELRLVPHGRGRRVAVTSLLTGQEAVLDATVLDALTRLTTAQLAQLVTMAMGE